MIANARSGFVNGLAPFGYRAEVVEKRGEKEKKRLVIDEDEADIRTANVSVVKGWRDRL
jgi:hypothetical protein